MATIGAPPLPEDPPHQAGEKETLQGFLDYQRSVMLRKVAGLDREALLRSTVPTGTSLLGMLKHLAYVERWWFGVVFAGQDLPMIWTKEDPDADFRVEDEESAEGIVAYYQAEVDRARAITAEASLDTVARRPGKDVTLRWILVHMIEETARHLGHADIIREQIDGATGD